LRSRFQTFTWQVAAALAIVAAVTFVCYRVIPVNATTAGFAYLLAVLAVGTAWGMPAAAVGAVAAMLCFNFFFLPPVGQFTIADPQNWVALFAFLATALVASHLSERVKKQALDARSHQRETEQLYTLSRTILLTARSQSVGFQTAQHIAEIFECRAVALYDAKSGETYRGGAEDLPGIDARLKQVVMDGANRRDPKETVSAIMLGGHPIGSLALLGVALTDGALQALLNLVAIALERVRMEDAANRAEAARQSEEFKSTLLDAIAHEFKTPLTSIKAASSSMLSDPVFPAPSRELAVIIDEESDRLNALVTEAVRMSQIDAGKVLVERQPVAIDDLVRRVLAHFEARAEGRVLSLNAAPGLPQVLADPDLVSLAIRQLIDNALKYSPPAAPVEVSTCLREGRVAIRVHDGGPGIPERDRERIFDKFYRRPGSKSHVPGTGLGLYIAREIIRTHGGDIWVENQPGAGSDFWVALPVAPK
jgi:two-component system sensor histidine kinase KdpD